MFSSDLPPAPAVYAGGGLLLVAGLLVAIALVAGSQVDRAQQRSSLLASQSAAMAYCVETQSGTARNTCMLQARAVVHPAETLTTVVDNDPNFVRSAAVVPDNTQGLGFVGFSANR
jgi:hypothetical protein